MGGEFTNPPKWDNYQHGFDTHSQVLDSRFVVFCGSLLASDVELGVSESGESSQGRRSPGHFLPMEPEAGQKEPPGS